MSQVVQDFSFKQYHCHMSYHVIIERYQGFHMMRPLFTRWSLFLNLAAEPWTPETCLLSHAVDRFHTSFDRLTGPCCPLPFKTVINQPFNQPTINIWYLFYLSCVTYDLKSVKILTLFVDLFVSQGSRSGLIIGWGNLEESQGPRFALLGRRRMCRGPPSVLGLPGCCCGSGQRAQ